MQNDHSKTTAKRREHLRPGAHIPSYAKARQSKRQFDGGYQRDERQSVRDLPEIRGERPISLGSKRNKP